MNPREIAFLAHLLDVAAGSRHIAYQRFQDVVYQAECYAETREDFDALVLQGRTMYSWCAAELGRQDAHEEIQRAYAEARPDVDF